MTYDSYADACRWIKRQLIEPGYADQGLELGFQAENSWHWRVSHDGTAVKFLCTISMMTTPCTRNTVYVMILDDRERCMLDTLTDSSSQQAKLLVLVVLANQKT
jgi:hypothetical protein